MGFYGAIPLPGYNIPTYVMPAHIYYSVPTEEDFECAVWRLRGHSLRVTSRIYGVQRRSSRGGGYLVGGGIDAERGKKLLRHRSCVGGVEGSNGDFKFLLRRLHHLP